MEFRQKKTWLMLAVLSLVFVAGCSTAPEVDTSEPAGDEPAEDGPAMEGDAPAGNVKTFVLNGGNFYFEMDGQRAPEIRVQQGDTVRVELTAVEGFHDFVIDEFNVASDRVQGAGDATVVEFVADQAGTFEYYCSVGSHRQQGMFGTFIVE